MKNFKDVYDIFFNAGEVTEIRAFGLSRTNKAWEGWAGGTGIVYGYFDNPDDFARAAAALERLKAPGIYFTINPVIPDLLARSANRLKAAGAKPLQTSDKNILCIRWLPIDLDPVRPSGISSTNTELKYSLKVQLRIKEYIEHKFTQSKPPILAVSGNGAHLLYRLEDLPNTEKITDLIRRALAGIGKEFSNKKINVDQKVFNPARIWKLYGTTGRKGDHTKTRPHRKSYIIYKPTASTGTHPKNKKKTTKV